jgi:hypothetical protein
MSVTQNGHGLINPALAYKAADIERKYGAFKVIEIL